MTKRSTGVPRMTDTFSRGWLIDKVRGPLLRLAFRIGLMRVESCWECRWARRIADGELDMCLCTRPSFDEELEQLGISGICFAAVTEGMSCEEFEYREDD